jgi:RimJ/RimL family protein N-acetyltransferase
MPGPRWAGVRARLLSADDEDLDLATATIRPAELGRPFTRWSIRRLRAYLAYLRRVHGWVIRMGHEALRCLLARRGITFQRTDTWKVSTDPERSHMGFWHDAPMIASIRSVVPAGRMSSSEQPVLRLRGEARLRPWHQEDAPALVAAHLDAAVQRWLRATPLTLDEARERISRWQDRWQTEERAVWAICRHADAEPVGLIGLATSDLAGGSAEVFYWLLPEGRGAGVMAASVLRMSRWGMDELGLHRLWLTHSVANSASCRVAQRAGFALEGTMRSALLHSDGWHDEHLHARVQGDDWPVERSGEPGSQ